MVSVISTLSPHHQLHTTADLGLRFFRYIIVVILLGDAARQMTRPFLWNRQTVQSFSWYFPFGFPPLSLWGRSQQFVAFLNNMSISLHVCPKKTERKSSSQWNWAKCLVNVSVCLRMNQNEIHPWLWSPMKYSAFNTIISNSMYRI